MSAYGQFSEMLKTAVCAGWLFVSLACSTSAQVSQGLSQPAEEQLDLKDWGLQQPGGRVLPAWMTPISSLLVPGSGQLLKGHERGALYLAAEAFFMVRFWTEAARGRQEREQYRELAFTVARAPFRPARRDTVFEYFEAMDSYVESGPFDTTPGLELVPPSDESTFNGYIWRLARETFLTDPDIPPDTTSEAYQRALDFYESRAIGANFQWSWRDAGLERDLYGRSIGRSDDAFRVATQYLGLILMNHLVSAIDALATERLGTQVSLNTSLMPASRYNREIVAQVVMRLEF